MASMGRVQMLIRHTESAISEMGGVVAKTGRALERSEECIAGYSEKTESLALAAEVRDSVGRALESMNAAQDVIGGSRLVSSDVAADVGHARDAVRWAYDSIDHLDGIARYPARGTRTPLSIEAYDHHARNALGWLQDLRSELP